MNIDEEIKAIIQHDENNIKGFFYEYRFLSNMELCYINYNGIIYNSSENAYQAQKTFDLKERLIISKLKPNKSKIYCKKFNERLDWNIIKKDIMNEILILKFNNIRLKLQLLATGNKYLEETNYWKDSYFGVYNNVGLNVLGEILMDIRKKLNNGK